VIERLQAGGLPLGITAARPYQGGNATLASGDLLFIFTDGLVDAEDSQAREYGEERMLAILQSPLGATAADDIQRIMSSVDAFVGLTRQHDDITTLVLRKT
jgi:sigma-B regulation protein RsbU (phosphoserine phosphatase)